MQLIRDGVCMVDFYAVTELATSNDCMCVNFVTGMFLEMKSFSGVEADEMTLEKLADDWEYLKFEPPLCSHALLLPRDRP